MEAPLGRKEREAARAPGSRQRPLVLDTSAILSGKPFAANQVMYTCEAVLTEFQNGGKAKRNLDYLLEAGLRVVSPKPSSVTQIEEAAGSTGDAGRLSAVDFEVLGLAKELGAVVVTDDYSMQNVAAALKLPFQPVTQGGITEVYKWEYRCRGCGKKYPGEAPECEVCGSEVRAVKAG